MILKSILLDGKSQPRQVTYFITPLFLENMNPYLKKEKIEILNVYSSEKKCAYISQLNIYRNTFISKSFGRIQGLMSFRKRAMGQNIKKEKC